MQAYNDTIVTHSDTFHCDEVFATALLQDLFSLYKICRTRDETELTKFRAGSNNYIVDVGKIYDPEQRQFDHHQAKKVDTFVGDGTGLPLSSFGMVWKHCGKQYVKHINPELSDALVQTIWRKFYHNFVAHIDANDNGITQIKQERDTEDIYNYRSSYTLPQLVGELNTKDVKDNQAQGVAFISAVEIAKAVLRRHLTIFVSNQLDLERHRLTVQSAFDAAAHGIMVLDQSIGVVNTLLHDIDPEQSIKLIVVPQSPTDWRIWTRFQHLVSVAPEQHLKPLVPDLVFVHATGFTGGAKTKEAAYQMAVLSIQYAAAAAAINSEVAPAAPAAPAASGSVSDRFATTWWKPVASAGAFAVAGFLVGLKLRR